ncbi:MAG: PDZ domain-containing protein [Rhodanobacteraceae bacterium]
MKTNYCVRGSMFHRVLLKKASLAAAMLVAAGSLVSAYAGDSSGSVATPSTSAAINPTVDQKLQEDLRVAMLDLIQTGAFGNVSPDKISLDVNAPAQRVSNLGVLVDSASAQSASDGLHVLAVTPGSAGERMGLQAGDTLVAVNGKSLVARGANEEGRADAATMLRDTVHSQRSDDPLYLRIRRDGSTRDVSGELANVYLPAMHLTVGDGVDVASAGQRAIGMTAAPSSGDHASAAAVSGCGRISMFDVAPRQQHLHGATLIAIDGQLPGPTTSKVFRVSTGTHTLKVGERIESRYLSFNDRLRNAAPPYKTITVDVQPDTTYFLAARLNDDQRTNWRNGAYWTPVIWRQSSESCR